MCSPLLKGKKLHFCLLPILLLAPWSCCLPWISSGAHQSQYSSLFPQNTGKFSTGLATRTGSVRSPQAQDSAGGVGVSARARMTLPWPWGGLSCPSSISLSHSWVFLSVQRLDLAHLQALVSFKLIVWRKGVDEWLSHDPCHKKSCWNFPVKEISRENSTCYKPPILGKKHYLCETQCLFPPVRL